MIKYFCPLLMVCILLFGGCQSDEPKPLKTVVNIDFLKRVSNVSLLGDKNSDHYFQAYIAEDDKQEKYIVVAAYNVFNNGCGRFYFQDSNIVSGDILNVDEISDFPKQTVCTAEMRYETINYPAPYSNEYQEILIHHYKKGNVDPSQKHHITRLEMPKLIKR